MSSPVSLTPVRNLSSSLLHSPTHISASVLNYALSIVQGRSSPQKNLTLESTEYLDFQVKTEGKLSASPEIVRYEPAAEPTDGVEKKFAKHGHHLMTLSINEMEDHAIQQEWATSNEKAALTDPRNDISRQLYVHALTYLLRALPANLTLSEVLDIGKFLPDAVIETEYHRRSAPGIDTMSATGSGEQLPKSHQDNSKLEEAIIYLIRGLAVTLKVSTPYVIELLRKLAEKEREYKVSERTLAISCAVVDRLSRSAVGNALMATGVNVLGAVGKGLGEGLVILADGNGANINMNANLNETAKLEKP
ncbi:hypothetical protein POJ06DRAFT_251724 [Lipomyces tetrasporus]|uniref:Uncharacterized protein n=1 Tax=Lipomyces tetrasporus TaxID=54092 RepID=A0AAD7QU99_9ASCO|nr:uncharacterized protein POJ06DRAFT_251724 [Lipomyces tetrasporus]KAJ8101520.1 hypothetical protein POJ06DRAFT_251724 [Lipomyces tetrasporus]